MTLFEFFPINRNLFCTLHEVLYCKSNGNITVIYVATDLHRFKNHWEKNNFAEF